MVELFQNPNVATALVERLPCAFAPSVNGKMGTHYAMVLLDQKGNVMYVGSECEHKHGEGVQLMHDMGNKDNTLCYVVTAAFRKALSTLHNYPDSLLNVKDHKPKDADILSGYMWSMFDRVWMHSIEKHNLHLTQRKLGMFSRESNQLDSMQRTVNAVTASLLKMQPRRIERGLGGVVMQETHYPVVFGVSKDHDTGKFHMNFANTSNGVTFAVREHGSWTINEDKIKEWAKDHNTVLEQFSKQAMHSSKLCLFCNETFNRMSKHTQGARHIDRVLEIAKLACKATSRTGLQMLNNPRTRSIFIK